MNHLIKSIPVVESPEKSYSFGEDRVTTGILTVQCAASHTFVMSHELYPRSDYTRLREARLVGDVGRYRSC